MSSRTSPAPIKIPFKEIELVTDNFSDANFIGEGFLGKIYEGKISITGEFIDVAVRRLDHSFWLQDIAFDKEISILSSLKHENIVSIIGFCNENDEIIIVNKCEARGSLSTHLTSPKLTWITRLKISIGVANALSFLHNDVAHNYSVIHHNVNTTSILLDQNWEAKLSGFEYSMTIPAGHIDLVYEKLGIGTYKSDVFSSGIVLFEILCGTKAFTANVDNKFQASLAIFQYENRKLHKFVDPELFRNMDPQSFNIFSETAYYCLDQQAPPTMNQVLRRLEKALEIQQVHENNAHSPVGLTTVGLTRPLSNYLKLKLKNLEHMRIGLKDIELATDNFAPENCIASGGFGTVYKGELDHVDREYCIAIKAKCELPKKRSEVAIKRIFNKQDDSVEEGFYAEIEMITKCKHSNILTLLGFCDEGNVMILIYEYASNGSLVDYIQNKSNFINDYWVQRIKICIDAAKGLSCLHTCEGDRQEIVHRDIKSSNILLGKNLDAKIGDFGLSKFLSVNEEHDIFYSRKIAGTKAYMDPEYSKEVKLRKELDVYSFGVVLFKILCGRLAYDPIYSSKNNKRLALVAKDHFDNGTIMEMVDPKIKEETTETIFTSIKGPNQDSVNTFSKIAYQCLAERQTNRPTMDVVVKELEKALLFQENRKDIFRISLNDIKLATKNFSHEIGKNRFWVAYKGEVPRANIYTTVKRQLADIDETEYSFATELKILMEYKHENVIGLVGFCDENDEKMIVYEHPCLGSLNTYLNNDSLTWEKRLKICVDVATGLNFLHEGGVTGEMVIHRDIKSSNILLDDDFKAKIAEFGNSIIRPMDQEMVFYTDKIAGSMYYIDPQYEKTCVLSKECDIYSFGVVLFEIMFQQLAYSKGSITQNHVDLVYFIKRQYEQGKLDEMVYAGTKEQVAPQSLTIFRRIAIQCLHDNRQERPMAGELVIQLREALEIQRKFSFGNKLSMENALSAFRHETIKDSNAVVNNIELQEAGIKDTQVADVSIGVVDMMRKDGMQGQNSFGKSMNYNITDIDDAFITSDPLLTVQHESQIFNISRVSPSWALSNEETKILVVGVFHEKYIQLSNSDLFCVCGDICVPAKIVQSGVFQCTIAPQNPGIVNLFLSFDGHKPISQLMAFDFRTPPTTPNLTPILDQKPDWQELNAKTRLAHLLFTTSKSLDIISSEVPPKVIKEAKSFAQKTRHIAAKWDYLVHSITEERMPFQRAKNNLFEIMLQNRFLEWLFERVLEGGKVVDHDELGQGVIHLCAVLDYSWAIFPYSWSGLSLDFRDKNGWTALHWAAHYGRQRMVASLLAANASPNLVTNPTSENPGGCTPADLASKSGYDGLAAYLAEKAMVSQFNAMELARNVSSSIQTTPPTTNDDFTPNNIQLPPVIEKEQSLRDTLAAYRTAADAAARIQAAFREHSIRLETNEIKKFNAENEARCILDAMRIQSVFRNYDTKKHMDAAAVLIQYQFRTWKIRKDFLNKRRKVIKIQSIFRGYQVRRQYRKMVWSVGVLEKAIIRWRLKQKGFRGLQVDFKYNEENEKQENNGEENKLKKGVKKLMQVSLEYNESLDPGAETEK